MKKSLENYIRKFVREYKKNHRTITNWQEPIIGYADAHDALFVDMRDKMGKDYQEPTERLASANTVISFFIPFEESTVLSNTSGKIASQEWAFAYVETNRLLNHLAEGIKMRLEKKGYATVLPLGHSFEKEILSKNYFQRQTAYIAGLGTFGINNMLMTARGCAGRYGSVITELKIEPTPRPTEEYCLFKIDGSCTDCADACPNGALTRNGFNENKCVELLQSNQTIFRDLGECSVCSKCVSNARCRFEIPSKSQYEEESEE